MMKNYLKLFVAVFAVVLLTNCEKEELVEQTKTSPIVERLNFKDLEQDYLFNKISSKLNLENIISFDSVYLRKKSAIDFQVVKSSVNKLVYDDYATYTFIIERTQPSEQVDFENLIIEKKDSIYKIYTIGYLRDTVNKLFNAVNFKTISSSAIDIENIIRTKSSICTSFKIEKTWCSETVHYGYHADCRASTKGETYLVISTKPCGGGGTPDPYGTDLGNNGGMDPETGHTPSGSDMFDNSNTITAPNDPGSYSSATLLLAHKLSLTSAQIDWLTSHPVEAVKIKQFLDGNGNSNDAEDWAKAQITLNTIASDPKWTYETGYINGRTHLKYYGRYFDTQFKHYKLTDGSYVIESQQPLNLNKDNTLSQTGSPEAFNHAFYYIKIDGEWANFVLPKTPGLAKELELMLALGGKGLATTFARYVLPVEDVKIIFTGTDLDQQQANRWVAAGFFLSTVIPGSKALKVVKLVPANAIKWTKTVAVGTKNIKLHSEIINGVVDFGARSTNNSNLRKVLGLVVGDGKHAHHKIPWEFKTTDIVQKAAKADKRFHISEKLNGIPLPSSNHLTGHNAYNTKVNQVLALISNDNMTNEQAYTALSNFINYLDDLIRTNSNKNLGQIADLINYGN